MASRVPKQYLRASNSPPRPTTRSKVSQYADLLSGLAAASALTLAVGCGNELPGSGGGRGGPQRVRVAPTDPAGGYFVSIDAKGKGCPADTWTTDVSPDGQTFNTIFSAYEVQVEPADRTVSNSCDVTIKLHSPQGLTFSVTSLAYSGYAFLDPSLRGSFTARYGFGPIDAGSTRRDESGPYDGPFAFEDRIGQGRAVWSPCGTDHTLTVRTQLTLNNGRPAGAGYVNLLAIDGNTNLVLGVSWRTCRSGRAQGT